MKWNWIVSEYVTPRSIFFLILLVSYAFNYIFWQLLLIFYWCKPIKTHKPIFNPISDFSNFSFRKICSISIQFPFLK